MPRWPLSSSFERPLVSQVSDRGGIVGSGLANEGGNTPMLGGVEGNTPMLAGVGVRSVLVSSDANEPYSFFVDPSSSGSWTPKSMATPPTHTQTARLLLVAMPFVPRS